MPDSPLLRTLMKVAHRISLKNKMSLKKFQVIWQPYASYTSACEVLKTNEYTILRGDFNAHLGNHAGVWKGVIGWHADANVNNNEVSYYK